MYWPMNVGQLADECAEGTVVAPTPAPGTQAGGRAVSACGAAAAAAAASAQRRVAGATAARAGACLRAGHAAYYNAPPGHVPPHAQPKRHLPSQPAARLASPRPRTDLQPAAKARLARRRRPRSRPVLASREEAAAAAREHGRRARRRRRYIVGAGRMRHGTVITHVPHVGLGCPVGAAPAAAGASSARMPKGAIRAGCTQGGWAGNKGIAIDTRDMHCCHAPARSAAALCRSRPPLLLLLLLLHGMEAQRTCCCCCESGVVPWAAGPGIAAAAAAAIPDTRHRWWLEAPLQARQGGSTAA